MALLFAAAAAASGVDLGIPSTPPWQAPAGERGPAAQAELRRHPLEEGLWERLPLELAALARWRGGLLDTERFARSRAEVFGPDARGKTALFAEFEAVAARAWVHALDHCLALDALLARYGRFAELSGARERAAAFAVAYAAYAAQARFARFWLGLSERSPALRAIFDRAVPELGVPAGFLSALGRRFGGPPAAADAAAARSQALRWEPARAVPASAAAKAFAAGLREDARSLAGAPLKRPAVDEKAALARLSERAFRPALPLASRAGASGAAAVRDPAPKPLLLPVPEGLEVSLSTRAEYAARTLRHWFELDPPSGERPPSLVTAAQARELVAELSPGDLLLARRAQALGEIGLPGYWHASGIFVGAPGSRRGAFGEPGIESELMRERPAEYAAAYVERSTTSPALCVIAAEEDGARLRTLEEFTAGDAFAALRPRLEPRRRAEAVRRAFELLGRRYDFRADPRGAMELSGAELVYRAFRGPEGPGLRLSPVQALDGWALPSSAIAAAFDAEFGTAAQQLDWVLSLEPEPARHRARRGTLEEFRAGARRPKWDLKASEQEESNEQ